MPELEDYIIGIDIGGTNIEADLIDSKTYKPLRKPIRRTFKEPLPDRELSNEDKLQYAEEALEHVGKIINDYCEFHQEIRKDCKVGIAVPGIISNDGKILVGVVFGNFHLREAVEEYVREQYGIKAKIHVENDANCGAYTHGEGQTLMIGTNLGSALNINGKLIGRNTSVKDDWQDYCIFDEAGFAIRFDKDKDTAWDIFKDYANEERFNDYFKNLAKQNTDSPNYVRLEQLLGGKAIPRIFGLVYGRDDVSLDARLLNEITDGADVKSVAEKTWEIEGKLLGYAVATLKNEAQQERYKCNIRDFHIGGKVALALHHMKSFAEESARAYCEEFGCTPDFKLRKSKHDNPNIIGAAIAYIRANKY